MPTAMVASWFIPIEKSLPDRNPPDQSAGRVPIVRLTSSSTLPVLCACMSAVPGTPRAINMVSFHDRSRAAISCTMRRVALVTVGPSARVVRMVMVLESPISAAGGTMVTMETVADEPAGMANAISSDCTLEPSVSWMGQVFRDENACTTNCIGTLPSLETTSSVVTVSLFKTGRGWARAKGPNATPSESNSSGEKSRLSKTVTTVCSVVSRVGSLTEVVMHSTSSVVPAAGSPS